MNNEMVTYLSKEMASASKRRLACVRRGETSPSNEEAAYLSNEIASASKEDSSEFDEQRRRRVTKRRLI